MTKSTHIKRNYVDGFIIVFDKSKLSEYKKIIKLHCKVWMEHGALDYYECIGDDVNVPWGKNFSKLAKARPDQYIAFSFITFKNKTHRNQVNKKCYNDSRLGNFENMPFSMKQFSYGGFKVIQGECT